jgi:DNA-binding beta-propeller fold protein YncE
VIDTTTDGVVKTLPTGGRFPVDILFSDDGQRAFISHRDSSDITILDLESEKVVKSLWVGDSIYDGVAQR